MNNIDRLVNIDQVALPQAKADLQAVDKERLDIEQQAAQIRDKYASISQSEQAGLWAEYEGRLKAVQQAASDLAKERKDIRNNIEREVVGRKVFKLSDGTLLLWDDGDYELLKEGEIMVVKDGDVIAA